jgi:hypothetical protein
MGGFDGNELAQRTPERVADRFVSVSGDVLGCASITHLAPEDHPRLAS